MAKDTETRITLTGDDLTCIRFHYVCESCQDIAEIEPSFFADAGTPICGNEDCQNEGDDMELSSAYIVIRNYSE